MVPSSTAAETKLPPAGETQMMRHRGVHTEMWVFNDDIDAGNHLLRDNVYVPDKH